MSATTKIAVHSLADLKNTTDDALSNYLTSIKFQRSHRLIDVRLALGYSAVILAGGLFYFDWKHGPQASKPYAGPAVAAYFALNAVFSYWVWMVEKGCIFEGNNTTGNVRILSTSKKYDPTYYLSVTFTDTSGKTDTRDVSASFSRWFTSDGYFVAKPFQQWLASNVPSIGAADPQNIVEEIGRGSAAEETGGVSVEEMLRIAGVAGATGVKSKAGGSGRKRKG
ncbi:SPC25-domain-containing protein [Mytilinidion resinicola]|uniref:Signal peptidase complex subunit 2 n=1 Tax=Mytilinidion resinicola TaxID=574789 RepID=A0A6A6YE18_9PEZI|nr:SPC25-domain-containing protein [Mytilinidion resinicola]KAF2806839.1 SPC25-domain-containing protein [Mytilinidion resinicola]